MKRIKELILVILLIMPIFINASMPRKYEDSLSIAKNYIKKGSYAKSSSKYIYDGVSNSHFISSDEFLLSKGSSGGSYLADGLEYWTSTLTGSSSYNVVQYNGQIKSFDKSGYYDARDTEYINPEAQVFGTGSYANPWRFDSIYEVTLKANTKSGYIYENEVTYGTYTKYVSRGKDVSFGLKANNGQMYITNDCNGSFNNGVLTIYGLKRNITCNVIFGTGRYTITLTGGADPEKIYSKYQDGFYKDSARKNVIYELNEVPNKAGYTYEGYKYVKEDGTEIPVVSGNTVIRAAAGSITSDITLSPIYSINNPESATISGGTTKLRNRSETELTCSNETNYASGTTKYYSFGSSDTENGTPTNWSEESTSSTFSVNRDAFAGTYYYKCRVRAKYNGGESQWVASSNSTAMTLVNARIDFDANGGTVSGTNPQYVKYNSSDMYSSRTGSSVVNKPTASKSGWSFAGWFTEASGGTKVINTNGTLVSDVSGWTNSSGKWILTSTSDTSGTKTLYAQYTLAAPNTPTISGGATRVYNYQATTLTCSTTSSYGTGTNVYYSFGYATSSSGTPGNWTTASTTATLSVAKNAYRGTRYYYCRAYAGDGTTNTSTVTSTSKAALSYVQQRIDFNSNGGTISGSTPLYAGFGTSNLYTGRTSSTTANKPTASKSGWTFAGWYTSANGGSQVINASGTVQSSVSGWTNASSQFSLSSTSDSSGTVTLYAHFTKTISGTVTCGTDGRVIIGANFTYKIYLHYSFTKNANGTITGSAYAYGGDTGVSGPQNWLTGTFRVGSQSKSFNGVVNTNSHWFDMSGQFGTGNSVSWSWSPTNDGNNSWTGSHSGTISF